MDAGVRINMSKRQCPLLRRKNSLENPDRFIPNRSAMDFDFAHYMLTEGRNKELPIASASAYHRKLAEALGLDRRRILAFKNKPTTPTHSVPEEFLTTFQPNEPKPRRYIPQKSEWTLDAPDIGDDYYLNLLDWGSSNVLALAIANTVHFWDPSNGSTSEPVSVDEEDGPITSVSWAANGDHIAIGTNNSAVLLWDCRASRRLTTFRGGHRSRVSSLAWNNHIITSGGKDGQIINNDVRVGPSQIATTYRGGHRQEVCGLKWSESGQRLASGGKDNLLHVWEKSVASSRSSRTHWLHRLEHHTAAVKALAWCPFQSSLLASGGLDGCIRFWNAQTGVCLNSIHTGSEVSSLLWNKYEREILSSHGFPNNQLTLWKYPAMIKMGELLGHTSRVLVMAQSPNGCTVASVSGDETLKIWNVFGTPQVAKPQLKNPELFLHMMNRIHIR